MHLHLNIGVEERDMWLACMHKALLEQDYPDTLIDYLDTQFKFPAERIHQVSSARQNNTV